MFPEASTSKNCLMYSPSVLYVHIYGMFEVLTAVSMGILPSKDVTRCRTARSQKPTNSNLHKCQIMEDGKEINEAEFGWTSWLEQVVRLCIMVTSPAGLVTKNNCAGEDQQQCTL
jgi:hypothetical protein